MKLLPYLVLTAAFSTPLAAQITTIDPTTLVDSFEGTQNEPTVVPTLHATAVSSTLFATQNTQHSLQVTMDAGQSFPGFRFNFSPTLNWSSYSGVAFDVYNPQPTPVTLYSRIDDISGNTPRMSGSVVLAPQAETSVVFAFSAPYTPNIGMKAGPLLPGYGVMTNVGGPIAGSSITDLLFYAPTGSQTLTLYFDNVRLIDSYQGKNGQQSAISLLYGSIIDKYGQFTKSTWPEKVYQDSDLNCNPSLPSPPSDRDKYGGSSALTGYGTTGYFHTIKLSSGTWWLVDPDGNLFFSQGVDSVGSAKQSNNPSEIANQTFVGVDNNITPQPAARYPWFTSLPTSSDPLSAYYGNDFSEGTYCDLYTNNVGCTFDFSSANLQRKFGTANFTDLWGTETLTRLRAWGFNTIGDFSDPALAQATDSSGYHVPYTIKVSFNRGAYMSVTLPLYGNPKIADPYDTNFQPAMQKGVNDTINQITNFNPSQLIGDAFMLGYFVDNEMPWSNGFFLSPANANGTDDANYFTVVYGVIKSPATQPAKVYWEQNVLIPEYANDINSLNGSWGTSYASWSAFLSSTAVPPMTTAMRADFSFFFTYYAEKYYKEVAQAIHNVDPNHLYLGSKYANFTPEVVKACGNYCDVISFDIYDTSVPASKWTPLIGPTGKPALVAEFQFGSLDTGAFYGGLVQVADQTARGAAYNTFVESVYANPLFVGTHWYQYQDQPLTGRIGDGENWGIGLTAITDKVYSELTNAATTTNGNVYNTANGGRSH